jgi:hypothetical protein
MWVMLAVEQPALTAVIARLGEAELNLAAFGVVFAVALALESPVIQMLAAATAVADSIANYRILLRFMHVLGGGLTLLHLLVGLTPLFDFVVGDLMNLPPDVLEASRTPFVLLAPFAASVGYRRFWQGVLIRHGKTWIVPVTMIARLIVVALVLVAGVRTQRLTGATLASVAIGTGVITSAAVAWVLCRSLVLRSLRQARSGAVHTWRSLLRFYAPLSFTTVVFLLSQPVITFGMARGLEPVRSLAIFPVLNGFLFLFGSLGLSYQETVIALLDGNPDNNRKLQTFSLVLGASVTGLMLLSGITPFGTWWFRVVSNLDPSLLPLVRTPLLVVAVIPALMTYKSWVRARNVVAGRTRVLAQAILVYTGTLVLCVVFGSSYLPVSGVLVAALSVTLAQTGEVGFLVGRGSRQPLPAAAAGGSPGT